MARVNEYEIRRVDPLDRSIRSALKRLQLRVDPASTPLACLKGWWWLVYFKDKPVAFGGIYPATKTKNAAYLARAGVLARHRGQGLQRELIRLRCLFARAQGFEIAVTDTLWGNHPSANNLMACGFRMYDPPIRWNPHDPHANYWRKQL